MASALDLKIFSPISQRLSHKPELAVATDRKISASKFMTCAGIDIEWNSINNAMCDFVNTTFVRFHRENFAMSCTRSEKLSSLVFNLFILTANYNKRFRSEFEFAWVKRDFLQSLLTITVEINK
jgi:hypothetical protein